MWGWLTADVVRYGYYFLVSRRLDWAGLGSWAASTLDGAFGNLSLPQRSERKPQRRSAVYKVHG
jgi:hypothetical protein